VTSRRAQRGCFLIAQTARLLRGGLRRESSVRDAQGTRDCVMPQQQISPPIFAAIWRESRLSRVTIYLGYRAKCLVKRNGSRLVSSAAVVIVLAGVLFAFLGSVSTNAREAADMRRAGVSAPASDIRKVLQSAFESLGDRQLSVVFCDGVRDNISDTDLRQKWESLKVITAVVSHLPG